MRRLPPKYDLKPTQSEGETSDPLIADHRNFYKVEKWVKTPPRNRHSIVTPKYHPVRGRKLF